MLLLSTINIWANEDSFGDLHYQHCFQSADVGVEVTGTPKTVRIPSLDFEYDNNQTVQLLTLMGTQTSS